MTRKFFLALSIVALAACGGEAQRSNDVASDAREGLVQGVDRGHRGEPVPALPLLAPGGGKASLADFRDSALLVNLWATWCAPCVKELPTLDRLAETSGEALKVLAVSQDSGPQASVAAFLKSIGIARLEPYQDPGMELSGGLNVPVLPTTILYDAEGKEVWRYVGDLDWTGEEATRLLAEAVPSRAEAH